MNEVIFNLVVIRSSNPEESVRFYSMMGLDFSKHRHGNGKEHFASEVGQVTFEIYPQKTTTESTIKTRLGFNVVDVNSLAMRLCDEGFSIIMKPKNSEWGIRAVVADPDGHKVELTQSTS